MKVFTLYSAAKECGTSRSTLLRAIKNGELIAEFNEESNQWQIELPQLLAAGFNPGKLSPPLVEEGELLDVREHETIDAHEHELAMYKVRLSSADDVIKTQQALIECQEKAIEDLRMVTRMLTRGQEERAASSKKQWWRWRK